MNSNRLVSFRDHLLRALALPSRRAATRPEYAPELSYGRHAGPAHANARRGAVLILFFPEVNATGNRQWQIVLTVRAAQLSHHAGQVSFPGGQIEWGESPEQAALREYGEELGPLEGCEIVGRLPEVHVFASNFRVTPVVAIAEVRPAYCPAPAEVADLLEVPLALLAQSQRRGKHVIVRGPLRFNTPHFEIAGRKIWGATWIMLGELYERLESLGPVAGV